MGQRRLSAAAAVGKTADHGGAWSEAETHESGRAAPALGKTADHGGTWSEAETHGSGRSQVKSGRSGAPHRDPWCCCF